MTALRVFIFPEVSVEAALVAPVYLVLPRNVSGVGWVHADWNPWRHRCAGQEVRIVVIHILDVDGEYCGDFELLHSVGLLWTE